MYDSSTDASSLSIFATGADTVSPQLLSASDADTLVNNGGVSDGRRIYSDVKEHTASSEFYHQSPTLLLQLLSFYLHIALM